MPLPDILDLRPKPGASVAAIVAQQLAINQLHAAATQHIAELHTKKKDMLLTASAAEIRAVAEQIARATVEIEQIEALQEAVKDMLPSARRAEAIASYHALHERAARLLAELEAMTPSYAEVAPVVAAFAGKSEEQVMAAREAWQLLVALQSKYPDVDLPQPMMATSAYHQTIALPAVSRPGWDGNLEVQNRFWPRPVTPTAPPPPEPPRVYGSSTGRSWTVRQPSTPTPPTAQWGIVPDWGAPDAA